MTARIVMRIANGADLDDAAIPAPPDGAGITLPLFYYALDRLARQRMLEYCAVGERVLVTAIPSAPLHSRPADTNQRHVFSRAAMIRCDGGQMVIETARSSTKITIHDPRVMAFLAGADALAEDEARAVASLLWQCGILVEENAEEGALAHWEFADLLLHARSRVGRHMRGYGGTYVNATRFPSPPVTKPPMSEESFDLPEPDLDVLDQGDIPFSRVLEGRRSTRAFADPPIDRRQLGEFLYRAARMQWQMESTHEQILSKRPYPGAGAIYELEIYPAIGSCVDLPRGLYHYDPAEHRLYKLSVSERVAGEVLREAKRSSGGADPQVVLTIAARFDRMFWKYESMRYASILKNVGALYQTMYLVAEAMGLGACALGGGPCDLLSDAIGLDYYAESAVGEFMIGSRAVAGGD